MRNASVMQPRTARRGPSSSHAPAASSARQSKGPIRWAVAAPTARSRSAPPARARWTEAGSGSGRQASQSNRAVASVLVVVSEAESPGSDGLVAATVMTTGERLFSPLHAVRTPRPFSRRLPTSPSVDGEKRRVPALSEHGQRTDDRMDNDKQQRDVTKGEEAPGRPTMSRRQAMGRFSAVAGAGVVAWVVPEILVAKPAAGATLSGNVSSSGSVGVSTSPSSSGTPGVSADTGVGADGAVDAGPEGVTTAAHAGAPTSLAFTGLNIQRDAEIGAALVAGGWAMQHWAAAAPRQSTRRASGARRGRAYAEGDPPRGVFEHGAHARARRPRRASWRDGPGCRSARS